MGCVSLRRSDQEGVREPVLGIAIQLGNQFSTALGAKAESTINYFNDGAKATS